MFDCDTPGILSQAPLASVDGLRAGEPDPFRVGPWGGADLSGWSSRTDLERSYREPVKVACDASALRRQLPAVVMAAKAGAMAERKTVTP
jgi:hypothetical protein